MSVMPAVSLRLVRAELAAAGPMIQGLGLQLDSGQLQVDNLRFRVSGRSQVDQELYTVEFVCDDYRELPPFIEMVDPDSAELGTKRAYPNCFHATPCICAQYNRKTYRGHTNLHNEWEFGEWTTDRTTDHLGGMINHIFSHIHGHVGNYSGRQA